MFSVGEAARMSGVSEARIYKWIHRYELGVKVGHAHVLLQRDIDFIIKRALERRAA